MVSLSISLNLFWNVIEWPTGEINYSLKHSSYGPECCCMCQFQYLAIPSIVVPISVTITFPISGSRPFLTSLIPTASVEIPIPVSPIPIAIPLLIPISIPFRFSVSAPSKVIIPFVSRSRSNRFPIAIAMPGILYTARLTVVLTCARSRPFVTLCTRWFTVAIVCRFGKSDVVFPSELLQFRFVLLLDWNGNSRKQGGKPIQFG